jgi:carboxymethylenebutenolidase
MSKPVCANCVTGFRIPGEAKGTVTKIGPFDTYVATPSGGAKDASKVIISFSDIFGMQLNNKIVADLLAEQTGYTTYLPDVGRVDICLQ